MKDSKTPWELANKLSLPAKNMLTVIKDRPNISSKEIQEVLNIRSGHTFVRHVNQLITNALVHVSRDEVDKRKKHFLLTDKGKETQEFVAGNVEVGLKDFFSYCESLYFVAHPELSTHKRKIGYVSEELFTNLKSVVFNYITEILKLEK